MDLIVVLSHPGIPQDVKLAREVRGIDVLLSSHTHNRLYAPRQIGDTLLIQSGPQGSFLGRLDLEVQDKQVMDFKHEILVVEEGIQPDQAIQAVVDTALRWYLVRSR